MSNKTSSPDAQRQQMLVIGAVVGIVAVVAILAIFASSQGGSESSGIDFSSESLGEDGVEVVYERTDNGGHIIGSPDAPATVVAFEDFLCPACQSWKPEVNNIMTELVLTGQVRFEYRFLPTQGARSVYAAQLAECAGDLQDGGFWTAHDELFDMFSNSPTMSESDASRELASRLDINNSDLIECTIDAEQVDIDQRFATQNGIRSTPSVRLRFGDDGPLQLIAGRTSGGPSVEEIQAELALGGNNFSLPPQ